MLAYRGITSAVSGQAGADVDKRTRRISGVDKPPLTRREIEVLRLLAVGKSNPAIAIDLNIVEKTVNNHMRHVLAKVVIPEWAAQRVYLARWYAKHSDRLSRR